MATIDRQVGASTDDCHARWNGSSWDFYITLTSDIVGYYLSNSYKRGGGMRFTNITIPKGSTINSAYLTITASYSRSLTPINSKVRGEDADNPSAFSDYTDYSGRARTSASVTWQITSAWAINTEYNSPDIASVIQEIIDRAGWASGNAMVIFWDDHDDLTGHTNYRIREGYSYDGDTAKCAQLHIEYTTAAGWTGKISGVTNPAKIMGVDVANIASVKGVS